MRYGTNDKHNILIIDDSEFNRRVFRDMMKDEYNIFEAENGEQGIEMIRHQNPRIDLVILDLVMPIMDGYAVLEEMNREKLVSAIPVIVVTVEEAQESLDKVYKLGVIDYCIRPYNKENLGNKIKNALTLKRQYVYDLEDSIKMLSVVYHKIVKANLTTNNHRILFAYEEELSAEMGHSDKLSEWLTGIADADLIHPEDKENYLAFASPDRLIRKLQSGDRYTSVRYRRLIKGEYRWVSLEVFPSEEYSDDNKVVILYVRDIDGEYKNQMVAMEHITGSPMIYADMNLTTNTYYFGSSNIKDVNMLDTSLSVDEVFDYVAERILLDERKNEYQKIMNVQNAIHEYNNGRSTLEVYIAYKLSSNPKLETCLMKIELVMEQNSITGDILAKLYCKEMTEEYINNNLPQLLYERQYLSVGLINENTREIQLVKFDDHEKKDEEGLFDDRGICSFDDYIKNKILIEQISNANSDLRESIQLDTIVDKLKELDIYEVSVSNGLDQVRQLRYQYFNKDVGIILATVEDISGVKEKDLMTGEYNANGFSNRMKEIIKNDLDNEFAVLYFDIKGFKAINTILGSDAGNELLRHMPARFRSSKLTPRLIGRLSSDQFVCLVNARFVDDATIEQLCKWKFEYNNKSFSVTQYCGVYYIDDRSQDPVRICDRARLALSHARSSGNHHAIYDFKMSEEYIDANELAGDLTKALQKKEFKVYYQPVFDAKTRKVVSAEALIRWEHPVKGMVPPYIFIPCLEENGMVSEVDLYVEKATRKLQAERYENGKYVVPISVNLSRTDFYDDEAMAQIKKSVECVSFDKSLCRYEVTESSYAVIDENKLSVLGAMREMGAQILVDDFGSGYSSFGTIMDYDFDIIKLDIEFVRKIGNNKKVEKVICSLIKMIHELGAKVIAEGAETKEQVDFLCENECDYIQGYYFSRPITSDAFEKMLDEYNS